MGIKNDAVYIHITINQIDLKTFIQHSTQQNAFFSSTAREFTKTLHYNTFLFFNNFKEFKASKICSVTTKLYINN